jgi:putative ABC transport system permease protein
MHDLRYAIRGLIKSPAFALATIATLAIAIAANTAMFSVLYAVVLQPLPVRDPDRIVQVWATDKHNASFREGASAPDFFDWQAQQTVFSMLAGATNRDLNLIDPNAEAERIGATAVSHEYFTLLGVKPLAGRGFVAADDVPGAEPVAILSDALWERRFGRRPITNLVITLDSARYRVVGVMPASASIARRDGDVWFPLSIAIAAFRDVRGVHNVYVVGRLKDGVTLERAQSEMNVISRRLEAQYPEDNAGRGVNLERVHDAMVRDARPRLFILTAAVVAVLLIACINIAGLMLARADARNRELAIRASLGASRSRIVRQLLAESAVIAAAGGILGIALAWWSTRVFVALAPVLPRSGNVTLSVPVLLFALGAAVLAAILFGVVPAIRTSAVRPASALAGARGVLRATRTAGRGVLVVVEVALAVVLVTGAALLLKSFERLMSVDLGVNTENLIAFSMKLPEGKYPLPSREEYPKWPRAVAFYDAVLERVGELPGVRQATLGMAHPLDTGFTSRFAVAGRPETDGPQDEVRIRPVTPSYFATMGMTRLRGVAFTNHDRAERPAVIVVNDVLAEKYFRGEDPVGKQALFWGTPRTIVGVVKSERIGGPQRENEPALYAPLAQLPMSDATLIVRASGDASAIVAAVRDTIRGVDPEIALFDVEPIDVTLGRTVSTPRFQAVLITTFGAIALILAALGLYALIAYQVQQRTNEIGIRLALGATRGEVARLVLRRAALLALTGIAAGLVGAVAAGRFLKAVLFEISATDPATFVIVPILLCGIALLASYIPTRRAMRVDPAVALRYE